MFEIIMWFAIFDLMAFVIAFTIILIYGFYKITKELLG